MLSVANNMGDSGRDDNVNDDPNVDSSNNGYDNKDCYNIRWVNEMSVYFNNLYGLSLKTNVFGHIRTLVLLIFVRQVMECELKRYFIC